MIESFIREGALKTLGRDVMNKVIREIKIFKDGSIELVLSNGWLLKEGMEYGSRDANDSEELAVNIA